MLKYVGKHIVSIMQQCKGSPLYTVYKYKYGVQVLVELSIIPYPVDIFDRLDTFGIPGVSPPTSAIAR